MRAVLALAIILAMTSTGFCTDHPECRWMKPMRTNQSVQCPNDGPADMARVATPEELSQAIFGRQIEPRTHPKFRNSGTTSTPKPSRARSVLNYDIEVECRASILSMETAIAEGRVNPATAIPDCVRTDSRSLEKLDRGWDAVPSETREACLAALGSSRGKYGLAYKYNMIAGCFGLGID